MVRFWTLAGSHLIGRKGVVGRGVKMQTTLSLGFGEGGVVYTGAMNGDIYVWKDMQVWCNQMCVIDKLLACVVKVDLFKLCFCLLTDVMSYVQISVVNLRVLF